MVVYLSLALNSPVKIDSLIHANYKLYYINIAKYTAGITKLQWNIFTYLYINFMIAINFYMNLILTKKNLYLIRFLPQGLLVKWNHGDIILSEIKRNLYT